MHSRLLLAGATTLLFLLFAVILWKTRLTLTPYVRIGMEVRDILHGKEAALTSEYPPLASTLFYLFQTRPFRLSFIAFWKLALLASIAGTLMIAWLMRAPRRAALFAATLLLSVPLFGPELLFARFDILILLLLFLSWIAADKHPTFAGITLGLAAALKIVPVILLPFLWLRADRRGRIAVPVGFLLGIGIGLGLPMLLMGPRLMLENIQFVRAFHGARGLQIESTWSGLLLLWSAIAGSTVTIDHRQGAFEFMASPAIPTIATACTIAGLLVLLWETRRTAALRRHSVLTIIALPLLWSFLTTPVLSPQYFVWILPLLLIEGLERFRHLPGLHTAILPLLIVFLAVLTQWIFPILYEDLVHLALEPVLVLNLRNACVGLLLWKLWMNRLKDEEAPVF